MSVVSEEMLQKGVDKWGKNSWLLTVLEEMSELQKEILKNINRGKDNLNEIIDETADVEITLDYLKYIYNIEKAVAQRIPVKLEKVKERLGVKEEALLSEAFLQKMIGVWGKEAQLCVLLEEMSELQKEILKNINRGKDNLNEIIDEAADVEIMLCQLKYMYEIEVSVERHKPIKIEKIKKRLEELNDVSEN